MWARLLPRTVRRPPLQRHHLTPAGAVAAGTDGASLGLITREGGAGDREGRNAEGGAALVIDPAAAAVTGRVPLVPERLVVVHCAAVTCFLIPAGSKTSGRRKIP